MPYCAQEDLSARINERTLIQLTDDTDEQTTVDQTVLSGVIGEVDELIDGHLRGRYTLPLEHVPGLLKGLAVDLVIHALYSRRPNVDPPDGVVERFKGANRNLEKIQAGRLTLDIGPDQQTKLPGEFKTNKTSESRVFGPALLDRF